MFTFQSIMFVSLGFLCALLLGFVVAPAFWSRAVRLTTERMRASVPLTEREIAAERDRLRAENAIRVHQLSAKIERARLYDARQKVEINRRDGTISQLQRRLEAIETEREGSENARRVLEATITQRVPEVEARLMEARQLLVKRDAEMKELQSDTSRTFKALDDAMQLNAQQRAEIDRLKMSLAGQGIRVQAPTATESEAALNSELEKLRVRSREQAVQIAKLQKAASERDGNSGQKSYAGGKDGTLLPLNISAANDDDRGGRATPSAPESDDSGAADSNGHHPDLEWFKAKIEEQATTIAKLTAQLDAHEQEAKQAGRSLSLRDSKAALKSRVSLLEKSVADKEAAIAGLRRDLATANERIARQASHYQEEFRRLGSRHAARYLDAHAPSAGDTREGALSGEAGLLSSPNQQNRQSATSDDRDDRHVAPVMDGRAQSRPDRAEPAANSEANVEPANGAEPNGALAQRVRQPAAPSVGGKLLDRIAELAKR